MAVAATYPHNTLTHCTYALVHSLSHEQTGVRVLFYRTGERHFGICSIVNKSSFAAVLRSIAIPRSMRI